MSGFFFKAVVHLVLLFGEDKWVVIPRMVRFLEAFCEQVAWKLAWRILQQSLDGKWQYTLA